MKIDFDKIKKLSINELEKLILLLNKKYYEDGESIVSDVVYDQILDILRKKDPHNKLLNTVGFTPTDNKVKLPCFAGSLKKIKNVNTWIKKYKGPYCISDKLDGISCIVSYKNGILKLYKRGDGFSGTDISFLGSYLFDKIKFVEDVIIRGELVFDKSISCKLKTDQRVIINGILNRKNIDKEMLHDIKFVGFHVLWPIMKQSDQYKFLEMHNIETVWYITLNTINNEILSKLLDTRKKYSKYEIDGIVVIDDSKAYDICNINSNISHGFAFKSYLTHNSADAVVEKVEWQISKDGYIMPRIKIFPVKLSNVTITYLTGFNARFIYNNKIGPGAVIRIIRSGNVIPHIIGVIKKADEPQMPDQKNIIWNGPNLVLNDISKDIIIRKLMHFFKTLKVRYISKATIKKLVNKGIDNIFKIINEKNKNYIIKIIGEKTYNKIINEINNKLNNVELYKLMAAYNILRNFGPKRIKQFLDTLKKEKNDNIIKILENITINDLTYAKGIENKDKLLHNIKKFLKFYNKLKNKFNIIIDHDNTNKKIKIVFSGFRDKNLEQLLKEKLNVEIADNITKDTDYLIYTDTNTNKYKKALKYNTKLIKRDDISKLLKIVV